MYARRLLKVFEKIHWRKGLDKFSRKHSRNYTWENIIVTFFLTFVTNFLNNVIKNGSRGKKGLEFSANSSFVLRNQFVERATIWCYVTSATVQIDRLGHSFVIDSVDFSTSTFMAIVLFFFFSFFLSLLLHFIVAVIETHFVGDTRSWSDFRTSIVSFTARDPVLCRRACARSRIGKISWSAARFVENGLSTNTFREKSPRIDKSSLINSRTLPFLETLE